MADMNNENRAAHLTSSMAYQLIPQGSVPMTIEELLEFKISNPKSKKKNKSSGFNSAGLTYIKDKQIEMRMNTCIDGDFYSRASAWGIFMEMFVYNGIGHGYEMCSTSTVLHPKYGNYWSGSVDLLILNTDIKVIGISEIKSYQKRNFALYSDCLRQKNIDLLKKEFPKEYWQIISNACIHNVDIGEAIIYMPYKKDIPDIQEMASNYDGADQWKYKFICDSDIDELPCIENDGYYKDICKFRFEIPKEDKIFLTSRIIEASKLLFA